MNKVLQRVFRIKPDEFGLVLTLGIILFINYAAMGIVKVVSVSGFLKEVKDHYILIVWAIDMVLLIAATGAQSLIIDRFNRIKLFSAVLLIFMALYLLLPLTFIFDKFPLKISYTLIYLLNDQQWRFFPIVFWILANDIFNPAQGRRLQPVIANFAFFGMIFGLGIAALDARVGFGPVKLLYFNASIFFLAFVLSSTKLKNIKISKASSKSVTMKETFSEGWNFIKTVPAFAYLTVGMLGVGIVMTILLYDIISDAKLDLGNGFQAFYAQYNLIIAIGSIFIQSYATRIIEKIDLKNSFQILPIVMSISTIINFFIPGYISSAYAQGVSRVTYDTIDLSARKAIQALVPNERRGRVSMFIDAYLPSLGTIVGSLITFGIISLGIHFAVSRDNYTNIYLGFGILIALLAIFSALRIRKTYDQSMLNWQLRRRSHGASVFDKLDFD
ncbi:MAG: MFS transporter [Chloroflexi bacterium]|nr:MFS transporter [Chloroflexota bacterium]